METILLLNPPTPIVVKDAARAVRRVEGLTVQAVTVETLTELLDLPGMRVARFAIESQGGEKYLHLFCEHQHEMALCPRCLQVMEGGYDHQDRCVRHLEVWGMRTLVHFPQRRFGCGVCGEPFTENLVWLDPQRRQTRAYEEYIYQRVRKTPRNQVAVEAGLSESTVLDIFKKWAQQATCQVPSDLVRVLGVDEISTQKGHQDFALVLSDLERRRVIAVLPNRQKDTLETWLDGLTEEQRQAIRQVSMDMWNPYRQAVHKKLAQAEIVADRFHVVKQLNHQLDLLRRAVQNQADEELAKALKGCRWILLKKRSALSQEEEAQLRVSLNASDELRVIYLLREEFRTICDKIEDRPRAERFLQAWVWKATATGSRYLIRFVNTLRNWWTEFLNYFIDRVTQGFVEGTNRAIRGIINRAFGFRNFGNFRLQILVECGGT